MFVRLSGELPQVARELRPHQRGARLVELPLGPCQSAHVPRVCGNLVHEGLRECNHALHHPLPRRCQPHCLFPALRALGGQRRLGALGTCALGTRVRERGREARA